MTLLEALHKITELDPSRSRADDLGKAVDIAYRALEEYYKLLSIECPPDPETVDEMLSKGLYL